MSRFLLLCVFVAGVVLGSILIRSTAQADVWVATAQWDDAKDAAFGKWIKNLRMDIFTAANSPYKGISTDCADAVYTLRIIFAFENKLPVKFVSSKHDFSNTNKTWDAEPEGVARVRKFIRFVNANTGTRSVVLDTYPIAVTRKSVRAGTLFVHPASSSTSGVPVTYRAGHVYFIQDVKENGMVRYFSSTVPTAVRDLQPRIDLVFAPFDTNGGFRAWKRPDSIVRPGLDEKDQFTLARWRPNAYRDGELWWNWAAAVRKRLALRPSTGEEEFLANLENVEGYIKERRRLVNESWAVYQRKYKSQSCMNEEDYDAYSTPTRDVKIQNELQYLRIAAQKYLVETISEGTDYRIAELLGQYRYEVMPGVKVDLNQISNAFLTEIVLAISEPEHSPSVRWGLQSQKRWPCPHRAKQYVGGELAGQ